MPRELMTAAGEDNGPAGQEIRRRLLGNARVVFFTPGYKGKRFIYETVR